MTDKRKNNELWTQKPAQSYQENEPYIYLSFTPWEIKEGLAVLSILNDAGCLVRYDEKMLTGRPWTGEICDAIEGCAVFFEINAPEYHFSLTKKLASEFAGLLEKKKIYAHLKAPESDDRYCSPTFFYCSPDDPSFPALCRKALDHTGYFSAEPEDSFEKKHDLMMDYYETIEDSNRAFGGLLPQSLNLRTHESHGYLGHSPRSDEDVFAAVRYGRKERYYLCGRSSEEDYQPKREDNLFMERIRKQDGLDPDLERKYITEAKTPEPRRPFPPDYPYMDEFEYLSSDDK